MGTASGLAVVAVMALVLASAGCLGYGSAAVNTVSAQNVIGNYAWFKTQETAMQQLLAQICAANAQITQFKSDYGNPKNYTMTSSLKRLDPVQGVADYGNSYNYCASTSSNGQCSSEILQADGTFGSSDSYVFWFDYEGNYYQWDGDYILSSKPLLLPTPTINFQQTNETN